MKSNQLSIIVFLAIGITQACTPSYPVEAPAQPRPTSTAEQLPAPLPTPTAEQLPAPLPTQPPPPSFITIFNDSSTEICYVYISPSFRDEWGDNWLSSAETIPPGSNKLLEISYSLGEYNIQVLDCNNNILNEDYGVMVHYGDELSWRITD